MRRAHAAVATASVLLITSLTLPATPRTGPDGNDYEVVIDPAISFSWAAARNRAHEAGAHLATIDSEAVDLFIEELRQEALLAAGIDPFDASAPPLWIGGSQAGSANRPAEEWSWENSEGPIPNSVTIGYSNWLPDEPNDWPSVLEDHQEDYLAVGHAGQFGWNDRSAPCRGYVLEYEVTAVSGSRGPVHNETNGHYYEFVLGGRAWTWEEAKREAECRTHNGLRGQLVIIDDAEEADFVKRFLPGAVATIGFNPSDSSNHPPSGSAVARKKAPPQQTKTGPGISAIPSPSSACPTRTGFRANQTTGPEVEWRTARKPTSLRDAEAVGGATRPDHWLASSWSTPNRSACVLSYGALTMRAMEDFGSTTAPASRAK